MESKKQNVKEQQKKIAKAQVSHDKPPKAKKSKHAKKNAKLADATKKDTSIALDQPEHIVSFGFSVPANSQDEAMSFWLENLSSKKQW